MADKVVDLGMVRLLRLTRSTLVLQGILYELEIVKAARPIGLSDERLRRAVSFSDVYDCFLPVAQRSGWEIQIDPEGIERLLGRNQTPKHIDAVLGDFLVYGLREGEVKKTKVYNGLIVPQLVNQQKGVQMSATTLHSDGLLGVQDPNMINRNNVLMANALRLNYQGKAKVTVYGP